MPAPIAAATGSSMRYVFFAPACVAASTTARSSTSVIPEGTHEILYHSESDLILAYNTVPERSYSDYIARSPSEHLLCFPSDLQYPVSVFIYCNHGRLPQNDAFAFHINKHRRCSEVDSYVLAHLASVKIIHLPHLSGRHTNS